MKVISRACVAQGVKAQCIVCKLQKSVSELTFAFSSDIDSIDISILLRIMHRVLQGCQPHGEVVVWSSFDISDQKLPVGQRYRCDTHSENWMQVSVVTSYGFGLTVHRREV